MARVIEMVGSLTFSPHDDAYAFLVHEVIEQMLSVKAGQKIYERLKNLCDGEITPERISLLSADDLRGIGTSRSKANCILSLTEEIQSGRITFDELTSLPDDEVIKILTRVRGIGNWTAKMYLMFVLSRPDVLPVEDVAFLQGYRWAYKTNDCRPATLYKKCKKWKPYSSYAARYFYRALDMGLTRDEFHLHY